MHICANRAHIYRLNSIVTLCIKLENLLPLFRPSNSDRSVL